MGVLQCNGGKLEEAEGFKCVFLIYCVLESKLISSSSELLSNNSLFVVQLYEDKSLALSASDLIFFTTDLQTVIITQHFTVRADLSLKYRLNLFDIDKL